MIKQIEREADNIEFYANALMENQCNLPWLAQYLCHTESFMTLQLNSQGHLQIDCASAESRNSDELRVETLSTKLSL